MRQRLEAARVQRNALAHQRAEHVQHGGAHDRGGRVEVAGALRRRAGEVDHGLARGAVDRHAHLDPLAAVELDAERAVVEAIDGRAHAFGGIALHVAHVARDSAHAEALRQSVELECAPCVRGELRFEICDVLIRIAGGVPAAREQRADVGLEQLAGRNDPHAVHEHAFLVDAAAVGRYRARRAAADVGVVRAARHHVAQPLAARVEHRGDDGHVRQMRAAGIGTI